MINHEDMIFDQSSAEYVSQFAQYQINIKNSLSQFGIYDIVNDRLINGSANFCEPYDELSIMDILWDYHICLLLLYDIHFCEHANMPRTFKRKHKLKSEYDENCTNRQYSSLGINHNVDSEYCLYTFEY